MCRPLLSCNLKTNISHICNHLRTSYILDPGAPSKPIKIHWALILKWIYPKKTGHYLYSVQLLDWIGTFYILKVWCSNCFTHRGSFSVVVSFENFQKRNSCNFKLNFGVFSPSTYVFVSLIFNSCALFVRVQLTMDGTTYLTLCIVQTAWNTPVGGLSLQRSARCAGTESVTSVVPGFFSVVGL